MGSKEYVQPSEYFDQEESDKDDVFDDVKVLKRHMNVLHKIELDQSETVWSIAITKEQTTWVGVGNGPFTDDIMFSCWLYKLNIFGKIVNKLNINFWPYHLAVKSDGTLLVSSGWTSSIIRSVNPDNCVSTFTELSPHWVYGLMIDEDDQVLVCLHSKGHYRGKVVLLSPRGKKLREIKRDEGGEWIFHHPFSVVVTPLGEIMFKDGKTLVTLGPSETSVSIHSRKRPMNGSWNAKKMVCDRFGHVLGGSNGTINVINTFGEWLFSFTDNFIQHTSIYGLALGMGDCLWIGTSDGKIFVVKYLE